MATRGYKIIQHEEQGLCTSEPFCCPNHQEDSENYTLFLAVKLHLNVFFHRFILFRLHNDSKLGNTASFGQRER